MSVGHTIGYECNISPKDRQSIRVDYQVLRDMLLVYIIYFGGRWGKFFPLIEFSYNITYHSIIQTTPFDALQRRKCRSLIG